MPRKLIVMVSSTVYGIEELLDLVYTQLTAFGYEVWMSHKGTVPVFSNRSAFQNCLAAVEKCDLFFGLITPYYGSGRDRGNNDPSITHMELRQAIEPNKPRWVLAHDHVVFARRLLWDLGFKGPEGRERLTLGRSQVLEDLRVIDMYEEATQANAQVPLMDRQGNWVQKYGRDGDASLFVHAQFSRYQEVAAFLKENFSDTRRMVEVVEATGGQP